MNIDLSKVSFTTVKKHKKSAAPKDPHCDVPQEIISNLESCIKFLDKPAVNIDSWSGNSCPKLWKPIFRAGQSARVQKKDGMEIPATPESEAISYQWRLSLRNTDVFLNEQDCKEEMYFPGGSLSDCVSQMREILKLLKGSSDFTGGWANVAEFEKKDNKVVVVNGRRKQVENGAKKPTLITTANYN